MSLLGCLVITEGYSVAYLLPLIYRKKITLSALSLNFIDILLPLPYFFVIQ